MRFQDALSYTERRLDEFYTEGHKLSLEERASRLASVLIDFPEEIKAALAIAVAHEQLAVAQERIAALIQEDSRA